MNFTKIKYTMLGAVMVGSTLFVACTTDGRDGGPGPAGTTGETGMTGMTGATGGTGGSGAPGLRVCTPTTSSSQRSVGVDPTAPLSSMVAVTLVDALDTKATNIPAYVKALVDKFAREQIPAGFQFPLSAVATDSLRAIQGLRTNVVVKWLDPLTFNAAAAAPRFGANADYIAYFGDGWNTVGNAPQFNGSGSAGFVWVNHEYVSNDMPSVAAAPTGQHLTLARWMKAMGLLTNVVETPFANPVDLDTYIVRYKKEVGGSWLRVVQDPSSCEWTVDRGAANLRYDASSGTQLKMTGYPLLTADHDDAGALLPTNVTAGIAGDCSGGQTPWGTIITAEENVQDYYGDFETAWDDNQKFLTGQGYDPGGAVNPGFAASTSAAFGLHSNVNQHHTRDMYGYLAEIDPGVAANEFDGKVSAGRGHKKLGILGRARWENATFVVDGSWKLIAGEPIVMYSSDDRRGGRIFKYVSTAPYTAGMSRTQIRALLDSGTLWVAHFEGLNNATGDTMLATGLAPFETAPGNGKWIKVSTTSTDIAPNATVLGAATKTVGAALTDVSWNGIGGFPTDADVKRSLFTAMAKIGIMELNRPEDLEWNPKDPSGKPRLYVAFTNQNRKMALDQAGKLFDPLTHGTMSPLRPDKVGSIFAMEEANTASPAQSTTFKFFMVWHGSATVPQTVFDAANPDNLMIDKDGGVWFGTDGNFGTSVSKGADAIYYLDLDPKHKAGEAGIVRPSISTAFRVASAPSDAETTGPAFTSDMATIFMSVQHPGEANYSVWP